MTQGKHTPLPLITPCTVSAFDLLSAEEHFKVRTVYGGVDNAVHFIKFEVRRAKEFFF